MSCFILVTTLRNLNVIVRTANCKKAEHFVMSGTLEQIAKNGTTPPKLEHLSVDAVKTDLLRIAGKLFD
jgi:hypothetical protein